MAFTVPNVPQEIIDQISSPSLVVFKERVLANIDKMIAMAGGACRLRPHCKTHKMAAVIQLLIERGVKKHKAATVAEAEMLFDEGAEDVLLAYNPVGPNIARVVRLAAKFADRKFSVTTDHAEPLRQLSEVASSAGVVVGVMLDINVGQNRTGVPVQDPAAISLYASIDQLPGLRADGFHVYDGHHRHSNLTDRRNAVMEQWRHVQALKNFCESSGSHVAAVVCGGTPTFPVYCSFQDDGLQLSPGTCIFHDAGYGAAFPDLEFQPAAAVLTRVVSRPAPDRATLDLGNKAIAADPPKGHRVYFPAFPDAEQDIHNEEHLVLVGPMAAGLKPGDHFWGIPIHICPTSALYDEVCVIDDGRLSEPWKLTSRVRKITI